jgi:sugar phosphate permease
MQDDCKRLPEPAPGAPAGRRLIGHVAGGFIAPLAAAMAAAWAVRDPNWRFPAVVAAFAATAAAMSLLARPRERSSE